MTVLLDEGQRLSFWGRVKKSDGEGCWIWTGGRSTKSKYGVFSLGKKGELDYAHRLSWVMANGFIMDGLLVLHSCDNPPCVRPEHLFLGTHKDNMVDASKKGRQHPGERTGGAVLTDSSVSEILALYATKRFSALALSEKFGVKESTMRSVVNGKTWTHVVGPRMSREEIVSLGKKNRAEARKINKDSRAT